MTATSKRRSVKTGLPPGALIHIGERHGEQARLTFLEYDENHCTEKELDTIEGIGPAAGVPTVTWIHIDGLHDIPLLEKLGETFSLHPLTLEDILNTEQRAKVEDHGDYLYIVLKRFHISAAGGDLIPEQISLVLGPNWLISLQEKEGTLLAPVRERLLNDKGRLRKGGADTLAHALIDGIVDSYFTVLDLFGERIEEVEGTLIVRPAPKTLRTLQTLKREMIFLRKSVWPLREMIGSLYRSDSSLIGKSSVIYFRDVYDHAVQVMDTIETYRDMLSGMMDIYLSSISNRMNEIMKVLTIIATVFMPLTFLAGLYGMNFKYMPELEWRWGYFAILGVMFSVAIAMLIYFRRKKWF